MKSLLFLLFIILIFSCTPETFTAFTSVECVLQEIPEYDGRKVSLLDDNGVAYKDTILLKIEKRRTIFKPCRDYVYITEFYDKDRTLITATRIKMTATGKRWQLAPDIQDEVIFQYEYSSKDESKAAKFQLNKKFVDYKWLGELRTGVIENVESVWMHPFRANQFGFTEVAPFPEIKYPLEIGRSWTGHLSIQEGWGDWENTSVSHIYKITAQESIKTKYGEIRNCWKVESEATYFLGNSSFNYWFSETLGFVKMNYRNYGGQYLDIELEQVIN